MFWLGLTWFCLFEGLCSLPDLGQLVGQRPRQRRQGQQQSAWRTFCRFYGGGGVFLVNSCLDCWSALNWWLGSCIPLLLYKVAFVWQQFGGVAKTIHSRKDGTPKVNKHVLQTFKLELCMKWYAQSQITKIFGLPRIADHNTDEFTSTLMMASYTKITDAR